MPQQSFHFVSIFRAFHPVCQDFCHQSNFFMTFRLEKMKPDFLQRCYLLCAVVQTAVLAARVVEDGPVSLCLAV
jgi:hypothetical protein